MLDNTQRNLLLDENTINDILKIFNKHQLTNAKIFSPQFSDQYGKINFLVTEKDYENPLAVNNALEEIKNFLKYENINVFSENILDEEIKPIVEREIIEFSYKSLYDFFNKKQGFEVKCNETEQSCIITIIIDKKIECNKEHLIETCSQAVQREINQNKKTLTRNSNFF